MKLCHSVILSLCVAAGGYAAEPRAAKPLLSPLFGSHAVLQRDRPVAVWGWVAPGTSVTLTLRGSGLPAAVTATAVAGPDGRWQARLGPLPAGGPHVLEVVAGRLRCESSDVLVGDVWLCSGQSNMEFPVTGAQDAAAEKAAANWPLIRQLAAGRLIAGEPQQMLEGSKWAVCTPETVGNFTAAGYFFARRLHQDIHVPVGLVNSSYGGTRAECWVSAEGLSVMPEFSAPLSTFHDLVVRSREQQARTGKDYDTRVREWYRAHDPGSAGEPVAWADAAAGAAGWSDVRLPAKLKESKAVPTNFTGTVWLRRDFDLPAAAAGKGGMLNLIRVKDMNSAWINGRNIGDSESINWFRKHRVPAGLLRPGRNTVAVRLVCLEGECGLTGQAADLAMTPEGLQPVPLAGTWKLRLGAAFASAPPMPARFDRVPGITSLYNGMIAPLLPLTMTGILWYQGESNTDSAWQYRTLLPTLIRDWRGRFAQGDLPFLIVQLPNHMGRGTRPETSAWAELREAQSLTAHSVPGCGLAVTIDIGEALNVHPANKQEVGRRLALVAEAQTYRLPVACYGPRLRTHTVENQTIRVSFDEAQGLTAADGQALAGFTIAGSDRRFKWAAARLDGATVVVSSPEVAAPVAVRYAWANNPACNLTNASGLPASPFRTDDWPGVTGPK
jgi:sialate O-acetylesterase